VRAGQWRLLARNPATNRVEIQTRVLSGLNRRAHALPQKRWDRDATLFNIQDYRSAGWQIRNW
jgi:hypothetical protein